MGCFDSSDRVLLTALPAAILAIHAFVTILVRRQITFVPVAIGWIVASTLFSFIVWVLSLTPFSLELFYCRLGRNHDPFVSSDEAFFRVWVSSGWWPVGLLTISILVATLVRPYSKMHIENRGS